MMSITKYIPKQIKKLNNIKKLFKLLDIVDDIKIEDNVVMVKTSKDLILHNKGNTIFYSKEGSFIAAVKYHHSCPILNQDTIDYLEMSNTKNKELTTTIVKDENGKIIEGFPEAKIKDS
ncbi:hypothetical protein ACVWU4_001020 [Campylobacter coli]